MSLTLITESGNNKIGVKLNSNPHRFTYKFQKQLRHQCSVMARFEVWLDEFIPRCKKETNQPMVEHGTFKANKTEKYSISYFSL